MMLSGRGEDEREKTEPMERMRLRVRKEEEPVDWVLGEGDMVRKDMVLVCELRILRAAGRETW